MEQHVYEVVAKLMYICLQKAVGMSITYLNFQTNRCFLFHTQWRATLFLFQYLYPLDAAAAFPPVT